MILVFAWSACTADPSASDTSTTPEPPLPPHTNPHTTPEPDDTGTTTETTGPQSALQFTGTPPTNLLIVSLDTTRRDYIGRFSGSGNTPNLDAVMAEGVVLENHRSCSSWTAPSMTCVVTGLTPYELGWWPWTSDGQIDNFDADLPTIAGQLQFQKGYRTTLVTANTVFDSGLNFDRGFDLVVRPSWLPADYVAADGLQEAADLADGQAPFYLHVHFIDPHGNYCPPEEFVDPEDYVDIGEDVCNDMYSLAGYDYWYRDQAWADAFLVDLVELYDAELEFWDDEFGKFWTALDTMGALDDTLVVFVTDHGEQILERGSLGHGNTLGSEENRSTAAFWAKNIVPQVWTGNTLHQDIAATLQDYFGVVPPTPSSGMVVGTAPVDRAIRGMLYWGPGAVRLSIVQEDQQLLYDFWGEKHYYDLTYEPTGLVDLYDAADPTVQALWVPMQAFADEVYGRWPSVGAPNLLGP
jgi:arylsulfatase A-like enzyme